MTRSAAARAGQAADALQAWLQTQPPRHAQPPAMSGLEGQPDAPAAEQPRGPTGPPVSPAATEASASDVPAARSTRRRISPALPLRPANPDWLHHRLSVTGPSGDVEAFRAAAAGAGAIPWHLDLDRTEEDLFHLLVAPPAPQQRTLSLDGARILARQLRDAVERRHQIALAQVGRSSACPFDLHALLPVPDAILRLGPDEPETLAWLWEHWGTPEGLRQVAADRTASPERHERASGQAAFRLSFWSADWTPWRALASLERRWPALRLAVRPSYDRA